MTVAKSRKKPRKQKFPRRAYDGLSQFPGQEDDGISHFPGRRQLHVTDWTELPDGLVDAISKRLPVLAAISMGLSCKSWRRVLAEKIPLSEARGLPWYMLVHQNNSDTTESQSLVEKRKRDLYIPEAWKRNCWGSVQDWLIVSQIHSTLLELFFYNPFSNTKLISLPMAMNQYYKILLSTSPADETCVYLLLDKSLREIAYWTPGISTWCKQHLTTSSEDFDDAVFCNGHFYFITRDFNICTVDLNNMISAMNPSSRVNLECHHHQVEMPDKAMQTCSRRYLVESCGEVLLVLRCFTPTKYNVRDTRTFKVFKLDTHRMVWTKMESVGDRILLIGNSDSRSFSAKELGDNKGAGCILFFRDCVFPGDGDNEWTKEKYMVRPFRFNDWGCFVMDSHCFLPTFDRLVYPPSWPPVWVTAPIWWYLGAKNTPIC